MGFSRLETAHTRVLAWLLDPSQEHGFDDCLLRFLFTKLAEAPVFESLYVEKTHAERPIRGGRLDVFLEGTWKTGGIDKRWVVLIEAKVDAEEGDDQLKKYDSWVHQHYWRGEDIFRLFVTPDKRLPETSDKWKPVSFVELACVFRRACGELRGQPGYDYLRFYLSGLLRDICNWNLPITHPDTCRNPYQAVEHLKIANGSKE